MDGINSTHSNLSFHIKLVGIYSSTPPACKTVKLVGCIQFYLPKQLWDQCSIADNMI